MKKTKAIIATLIFALTMSVLIKEPSNNRSWNIDQEKLSYAEIDGSKIHVKNIRNIKYRTVDDFDVYYYDKTFDLEKIKSIDFMVEPFEDWRGPAHTLLSFGFDDGEYVAISVEIRKEKGEEFSPWKGLIREYELMYVIGDEEDLIKLRTNYRKDDVYLYPIKTTKAKMQSLFLDMITRANELKEKPEFYNTLTSTCTTNIVDHVNKIAENPINIDFKILFPGYSDEVAYELGLIDTNLPLEEVRQKFQINELAEKYADAPDFSQKIRMDR